jgi:peroxiredoxin/protein-disulfide isomerase
MSSILAPGIAAPDFNLSSSPTEKISLKDSTSAGNLVLVFYPEDGSAASANQMSFFSEISPEFESRRNTRVLGISTDSVSSQQSFAAQQKMAFTLLSDSEPKAAVAKAYGVFSYTHQLAQQAIFLIDWNGRIRWSFLSPPNVNPGADGILNALDDLLEEQSGTSSLVFPVGPGDHIQGSSSGLILLGYGDYQSPDCNAARAAVQQVQTQFGNIATYVYRHFPLTRIHSEAQAAAEVAEFAAAQGKFWEMHEKLFDNQATLGPALYTKLATDLGLDPTALQAALTAKTYAAHVQADSIGGIRSGVNGTPCFFMSGSRYDGKIDGDDMIGELNAILAPG